MIHIPNLYLFSSILLSYSSVFLILICLTFVSFFSLPFHYYLTYGIQCQPISTSFHQSCCLLELIRVYFGDPFLTSNILFHYLCSGMSTAHAIFIATISLYFVFWSDLYSDHHLGGLITFRSSPLSSFALGVSVRFGCLF